MLLKEDFIIVIIAANMDNDDNPTLQLNCEIMHA
jgi:hypothetical protein